MIFLFSAIVCVASVWGLWVAQRIRWERIQVRVLKTWEEVTGDDEGYSTGWLHADIEYWYQSQKYAVHWRGDLRNHRFLPDAIWMVVDHANPDQPQMSAHRAMAFVLLLIAIGSGLSALRSFS
jgi:hypothetical protein